MGFISDLFSSEPDLETFSADQMIRYTNSLTAWLDAHPIEFNTPEHIKEKVNRKRTLLDKAMAVWQRKMIEHAEQNGLPNPFPNYSQDPLIEIATGVMDDSTKNLQNFIEYAASKTGLSNEEIQKYSIDLLNKFEKDFLSQGLPELDAAASAFSRLITERPLPNIKLHKQTKQSDAIQYKIKPGVGLIKCPIGSSYYSFSEYIWWRTVWAFIKSHTITRKWHFSNS